MNTKVKNALKYTLSFALAGGLLYLSFRKVGWEGFLEGLRQTDWGWILLSMGLAVLAFTMRGLRWNQLLKPLDPSIRRGRTISAVCVGNLSNCVIPASGDFVRSGLLATPKAGFDKVLGTVALERAWDLLVLGLVFLLIFIFNWGGAGTFFVDSVWTPLMARFGMRTWLLLAALVFLAGALLWAIIAFRKRNALCGKIYGVIRGILQGFVSFKDIDRKGLFLLYSVGIWAAYWFMCVCISHAFPPTRSLTIADGLFLMAAGSLQSMIPAPGGFGTYHYVIALCLSGLYGFSWETGIVFATLSHESQTLTILLTGLAGYLALTLGKKNQ
jgi:hypothetical protein